MSTSYLTYDGNEWERRVLGWLHLRYPGKFEECPAEHHGDFGLDGFSRDGIAYQCSAPQTPLKVKELFENQRNKMNQDIDKFIDNKKDLLKLFGTLKIGSWWFVVPQHRSSKIVQHATSKASYVQSKKLPYATIDFHIHIATGEDFAVERQAAIRKRVEALELDVSEVLEADVQDWADKNDQFVQVLDRKIRAYSGETRKSKIRNLRDKWIERFIVGENTLKRMEIDYPDIWQEFRILKTQREKALFTKYSTTTAGSLVLRETLNEFTTEIENNLPNLVGRAEELSVATVAEWLLQCPLDFPDGIGTKQ